MNKDEISKIRSQAILAKYATGWSPRKGKKHSEAVKKRISEIKKAQHFVPKSAFKKGYTPWNKGMKAVWVSERNRLVNPTKTEEMAYHWLGDKIKYRGLHKWVARKLGQPDTCTECRKSGLTGRQIHWANISGGYLRDISDWKRLCVKCHKIFDKNKRVTN